MALSKDLKNKLRARLQSDYAFRFALLSQAVEGLLAGDYQTATNVLHDFIDATVGFPALASDTGLSERTLLGMFDEDSHPRADDLFRVLASLQKSHGIHFSVEAAA